MGIKDLFGKGKNKTMLRREIYNQAAGGAKARGKLTDAEAAELGKIQKFLALRDDQLDGTRRDLARLRVLTGIRQGNHTLLRFKSGSEDTAEIAGELLSASMR